MLLNGYTLDIPGDSNLNRGRKIDYVFSTDCFEDTFLM
jgi:hypothetical protein